MIVPAFLALVFILQGLAVPVAWAASFAECQAWLCLPAGFSTHGGVPVDACEPAHQAVLRRLRLNMDPLPPWSSCAAQFGWDAAHLAWTFPTQESCPHGGSLNGGVCTGTDGDGCTYTYTPRNHGHVWVWVDGAQTGESLPHTLAAAGSPTRDTDSCSPPDTTTVCLSCDDDPHTCPEGWFWSEGLGKCVNPLVVGPPVPGCNTISCPHVQHTWGANPLEIDWTLRAAVPPTHRYAPRPISQTHRKGGL